VAKQMVMDEFHLTLFVPRGLSTAEYDAIRQTLDDPHFHAELRRAIRQVIRRHPALSKIKVRLSQ
jgi:hypothetical protein